MNSNDQQYVDHLYRQIFAQQVRFNHFNAIVYNTKSVWNRSRDEKEILDKMVLAYKKFYSDKAVILKTKFEEIKDTAIASYLTYNTEYHINNFNKRIEEIDKYLVELQHQIDSLRKKPSDRLDSLIHFQMRLYDTLYYYLETKDNDLFLETCQILMSEAPVLPASGFLQMKPAPAFKMVLDEIRRREGRSDNLSSQSSVSIR